MRRLTAILLISLQLLTGTELCQLLKLPVLIEHFREHGELYRNFSFFNFIRLHYFIEDDKDGDYDRDMQLPFKTNAGALLISNSHSVTVPLQVSLLCVPVVELQQHFSKFYSRHIPSAQTSDIFQPPRS